MGNILRKGFGPWLGGRVRLCPTGSVFLSTGIGGKYGASTGQVPPPSMAAIRGNERLMASVFV